MKFETLKSFNKKKVIIPTVIISCLVIVVTIFVSHSKYVYKDSITIMDDEVNYKPYDFKTMAIYQQKETCTDTSSNDCYEEKEVMPSVGYTINEEKSYCYIDDESVHEEGITLKTNEKGEHVIGGLSKRSKCFLYFDKEKALSEKTYEQLLALNKDLQSKGATATFTGTSCDELKECHDEYDDDGEYYYVCTGCNIQENGMYEAPDDDGISYYFRGTVENNYVKFGKTGNTSNTGEDIWWRIIRINGDGSIRMIFAGTGSSVPNQTGSSTIIGEYAFNNSHDGAEYVGFEYADNIRNGSTKYFKTDTVQNTEGHKSNALQVLETWFRENLEDELNDRYIDEDAGFCADRTAYEYWTHDKNDNLGIGTQLVTFGGVIRNYPNTDPPSVSNPANPSLKCEDKNHDLFTYAESTQGTKSLTYPIGLITVDELTYAGGCIDAENDGYYLNSGQNYWTMSPMDYVNSSPRVVYARSSGGALGKGAKSVGGIRPVINLKSSILTLGNGSSSNPFRTTSD